jgi:hypothetical protein
MLDFLSNNFAVFIKNIKLNVFGANRRYVFKRTAPTSVASSQVAANLRSVSRHRYACEREMPAATAALLTDQP